MRNVTMKDIAEKLGISIVSVSKALTDKQGVSDELREKIKQEADKMGYRYNLGAKALKEGKNYNIGVIVPSCYVENANAFYLKMYQGVAKDLTKYDYATMLELIEGDMQKNLKLPEVVLGNKIDALIVLGELTTEYLEELKKTEIPMIYIDFYDLKMEIDSVSMDNVSAEYEMTEYLIQKGHKKIAYVGSIDSTTSIMDRYVGYRRAMHRYGLEYQEDYLMEDRDENGIFVELQIPQDMPTAFVCNNDEIACILIEKLEERGIRVPEDVAVAGFDNYPFIRYNASELTTVNVDIDAMAREGVLMLLERLKENRSFFARRVISGKLIIRSSTDTVIG